MERLFRTPIFVALLATMFVIFMSSCTSDSESVIGDQTKEDIIMDPFRDPKAIKDPEPITYAFTPSRIGVSPKRDIKDGVIKLADGVEVKGTMLEFTVSAFDSTGRELKFFVSAGYAKDTSYYKGDDPVGYQKVAKERYSEAKKLYDKIINTEKEDFIVTCTTEGLPIKLEKVNRTNNKKIGKIDLIEFEHVESLLPIL